MIETIGTSGSWKARAWRPGGLQETVRRLSKTGLSWLEILRQRRHLADLDAHLLRDIGLSETDRARELDKPFWRL